MRLQFLILKALIISYSSLPSSVVADENSSVQKGFALQSSYAWSAKITSDENSRAVTVDGKSEKNGFSALTVRFGDRNIEGYMLGDHAFVTSPDRKWTDIPEMKPGESPTIFMDRMIRAMKLPAAEIAELTRRSTNLREENGVSTADLDEEAAKDVLQRSGGRAAKDERPSQAKGDLKVWTTNGIVSKYQYTLSGKQPRDGQEVDVARTVTVEITDVGTTTVAVPERIKEKLKAKTLNQATAPRPE